jgi:CRP-like cAMP-binding protein
MNHLLAALPPQAWQCWRTRLELVDMPLGMVLYEAGGKLSHVYWPVSAVVSKLYHTADGASSELAVVGREGVVGTALFMGADSTLNRAVVISAGQGYRLSAQVLLAEFEQSSAVAQLLLRYTQALMTQMAQMGVCNRHHRIDMRLCRWLLMLLDRLQGDDIAMTHETIARMLGVRREGITEAALKLQKAGVISYARGHITVLDRVGLAERSCECYRTVKREYERLLPQVAMRAALSIASPRTSVIPLCANGARAPWRR